MSDLGRGHLTTPDHPVQGFDVDAQPGRRFGAVQVLRLIGGWHDGAGLPAISHCRIPRLASRVARLLPAPSFTYTRRYDPVGDCANQSCSAPELFAQRAVIALSVLLQTANTID
jgi:hypothetical protein